MIIDNPSWNLIQALDLKVQRSEGSVPEDPTLSLQGQFTLSE